MEKLLRNKIWIICLLLLAVFAVVGGLRMTVALAEEPSQEVAFVEFDADRNNGAYPWGDNRANVLYFDKPLYNEKITDTLVKYVEGNLATHLTINGVTAEDLGVVIVGGVLSKDGKNGLEFYISTAKMPKFKKGQTQIVLEIKEGAKFLNNNLPALKFYLNENGEWQEEEYTCENPETVRVTFTGVNRAYNNVDNPWRTEDKGFEPHYLSAFIFSETLAVKGVKDGVGEIAEKIELNGTKVSELGFLFSTTDNSNTINVQYPKASLSVFSDEGRHVRLVLTEDVEFGDVVVCAFSLYLNEENMWEQIDASDKTAPEIIYNGAKEIISSEGKKFSIEVSAYDWEDEANAELLYIWSDGALDDDGNLRKGEHTCTLKATDYAGNQTLLEIKIQVLDRDTECPSIEFPSVVNVIAGVKPEIVVKATDNYDDVLCEFTWSDGALDEAGKIVEGTHKLFLKATDLSGNSTEKEIIVNVTNEGINQFIGNENRRTDKKSGCQSSSITSVLVCSVTILFAVASILQKKKTG